MITLLTDFGLADYFVPAVRGTILSFNPHALLTDITHEIPAHDVASAAFTLGACWHDFPAGTIHLAVVDPGVGSARRVIVVAAGGHLFVGPDNGLFSYVYARETMAQVYHVTRTDLYRHPVSATFHGRDIFAPLAAHLSLGMRADALGPEISDYQRFALAESVREDSGSTITGAIIHIDRFGNCVTSLTPHELTPAASGDAFRLKVGEHEISRFVAHYEQAASPDELFAYPGSAGYWEIAMWQQSAAHRLQAYRGMKVRLERCWS